MDAIEALDDGANAHFTFQADQFKQIVSYMQPAYQISSYIGIAVLVLVILALFVFQGKKRAAFIAAASFLAAIALIELLRFAVPRPRPQDAVKWLGDDAKSGSFPSVGVFLFMLALILLGAALWEWLPRTWMRGAYVLIALALTVWVCLSQFYLALHFVTDVIAAIAGATLIGWTATRLLEDSTQAP